MGHLGDKLALLANQGGLFAPVQEDDVNADKYGDEQQQPFCQDQPVRSTNQKLWAVFFGQCSQLAVIAEKPVKPDNHCEHPGDLDADESHEWIKYAVQPVHRPIFTITDAMRQVEVQNVFTELLQSDQ